MLRKEQKKKKQLAVQAEVAAAWDATDPTGKKTPKKLQK